MLQTGVVAGVPFVLYERDAARCPRRATRRGLRHGDRERDFLLVALPLLRQGRTADDWQ